MNDASECKLSGSPSSQIGLILGNEDASHGQEFIEYIVAYLRDPLFSIS